MTFYPSLMRTGLMMGVAAAAIMAAGAAWAAACTASTTYTGTLNSTFVPGGGHLKNGSATPACTTSANLQSVTCTSYTIVGIGSSTTTGGTNLVVHYNAPPPATESFSAKNNVTVPSVS